MSEKRDVILEYRFHKQELERLAEKKEKLDKHLVDLLDTNKTLRDVAHSAPYTLSTFVQEESGADAK